MTTMVAAGVRARRMATAAALVGLVVGLPHRAAAQQADDKALRERIESVEAGQRAIQKQLEAIQKQLQDISGLLRAQGPAQRGESLPAELSVEGAAQKGQPTAKLTIVEFSDFQCPFCGRYARETLGQIERDYIETGKVRYAFRNLPLESIHPQAFKASEAAECAGTQGKYWEVHDRMFANQQALRRDDLVRHAQEAGLEMAKFERCLDGEMAAKVRQDLAEAAKAGVTSTPTFFIGLTQPGGKVKVLRRISGAQPYENFKAALEALLAPPAAQE